MRIHNLPQPTLEGLDISRPSLRQGQGDDFAKQLMDVMKEVNSAQQNSAEMQTKLVTGQPVEYHDVMIAVEKAGLAMNLTMTVRNKVLEAYQEIMRTQV
jgi:flagellar hook-basal body complex protein FliE